ncbi:MAG: hypothetical protein MJE66_24205 [Proteobacteria bacterium]|nr:hypothetical protein [Pseudomonadota bacterium]
MAALVEQKRQLAAENEELRRTLTRRDDQVRTLEERLRDLNQRRRDVIKRIDELIAQVDGFGPATSVEDAGL